MVSDSFGKMVQAGMDEVLSVEAIDEDKITKLIHSRCKNKDKIIESLKVKRFDWIKDLR